MSFFLSGSHSPYKSTSLNSFSITRNKEKSNLNTIIQQHKIIHFKRLMVFSSQKKNNNLIHLNLHLNEYFEMIVTKSANIWLNDRNMNSVKCLRKLKKFLSLQKCREALSSLWNYLLQSPERNELMPGSSRRFKYEFGHRNSQRRTPNATV